ncbi:immunoglobulin kappa light chain-like [Apus apus]|uniref:immunoglobulin kappa light chain-like n=1 Tax=Apus apus TaxID=8895 RepID=UPI0021F8B984|nr:immunoglobulin kappa light chain-like [Apus apus]
MLLLAANVATATWSYGIAQKVPLQIPLSTTKSKGSVRLLCHFKGVSGFSDSTIIHWYQQKANKAPERMPYFSRTETVDEGTQAEKFSNQKLYILTIKNVIPEDTATYYCAYWHDDSYHKVFGSGTKLIVSDKGSSEPAHTEILQTEHQNQLTYLCLIEKFYPEVIRLTWTDGEKEITDNVVKGGVWKSAEEDEYSIGSWLTVPAENKDKNYYCKYQHESKEASLPTQDDRKKTPKEENCSNSTYPGFIRDHLMPRTAYLVYIILLLKSSMYYLIVLFFIYRMWASTKKQENKA